MKEFRKSLTVLAISLVFIATAAIAELILIWADVTFESDGCFTTVTMVSFYRDTESGQVVSVITDTTVFLPTIDCPFVED